MRNRHSAVVATGNRHSVARSLPNNQQPAVKTSSPAEPIQVAIYSVRGEIAKTFQIDAKAAVAAHPNEWSLAPWPVTVIEMSRIRERRPMTSLERVRKFRARQAVARAIARQAEKEKNAKS